MENISTNELIGKARTIAHFLAAGTDSEQIVRDVHELANLIDGKGASLPEVIYSGLRCELYGGYVEQDASVTTGNWREVVERLLYRGAMPPQHEIIVRHCACRDQLSGVELYQLEQIADGYDI